MKRSWKTLVGLAAATAATLALTTSALAVGGGYSPASAAWRISLRAIGWSGRLTALYPGARGDTELLHFRVTNTGHSRQRLGSIRASMRAGPRGDAVAAGGAGIPGCRAGWFTVSVDRGNARLPVQVAPGASYFGAVDLAMRDSGDNQNACRGAAPAVTISAGP
jgi:hypothetical protein